MKIQLFEMENNNQNDAIISMNGAFYERKWVDKIMFDFENIATCPLWLPTLKGSLFTEKRAVYSLKNCSEKAYIVTTGV